MTSGRRVRTLTVAMLAVTVSSCASIPWPVERTVPDFNPAAAVAAVRAVGRADAKELDVQPLRDPRVEDLRQRAATLEREGDLRGAGKLLDHALSIQADNPALLQERAENALLQGSIGAAERWADQAVQQGSTVGPLCRRHWETIAQVRAARAEPPPEAPTAAAARKQRDACTVAAPKRY